MIFRRGWDSKYKIAPRGWNSKESFVLRDRWDKKHLYVIFMQGWDRLLCEGGVVKHHFVRRMWKGG